MSDVTSVPAFLRPAIEFCGSMAETKEEVEKLEKKIYEKKLFSFIIGARAACLIFTPCPTLIYLGIIILFLFDNCVKTSKNMCENPALFSNKNSINFPLQILPDLL